MPKLEQLPGSLQFFRFLNAAPLATGRDFNLHMERLIRSTDQILVAQEEARRVEDERRQAEELRRVEEARHKVEIDRRQVEARHAEEAAARKRFQEEQARRAEEIAQEARRAREARQAAEISRYPRSNRFRWYRLRSLLSGGASVNPRSRRLRQVRVDYQRRRAAIAVGLLWAIVASLALSGAIYEMVHAKWPDINKTEIDITVWASVIVITIVWLLYFLCRERSDE